MRSKMVVVAITAYPIHGTVVAQRAGCNDERSQVTHGRMAIRYRTAARCVITLALLAAAPAAAVETWRSAPLWGGDVASLAFAPADPNVAVAGTAAGNVYLT